MGKVEVPALSKELRLASASGDLTTTKAVLAKIAALPIPKKEQRHILDWAMHAVYRWLCKDIGWRFRLHCVLGRAVWGRRKPDFGLLWRLREWTVLGGSNRGRPNSCRLH